MSRHYSDLRCRRCARTQPALPRGVTSCVYCGYPLPVQRWLAHPPAGVPRPPAPTRPRPYQGPPRYHQGHPNWGFPPVVWRPATRIPTDPVPVPRRALQVTAWFCVLTAAVCMTAAAAESWRWTLMLRGRTEVLPAGTVHASDVVVRSAGLAAGVVGTITLLLALGVVVRTYAAADDRAGVAPTRRPAAVLARLVVPVWNLYGAGQIFAEIDGRLARPEPQVGDDVSEQGRTSRRTRVTGWVLAWWAAWVVSGVLVLAALGRAFGGSVQAIADTVELHLAVDALATLVAAFAAVIFFRWARVFTPRPDPYDGWVVAPPAPTRQGPQPESELQDALVAPSAAGPPSKSGALVSPRP